MVWLSSRVAAAPRERTRAAALHCKSLSGCLSRLACAFPRTNAKLLLVTLLQREAEKRAAMSTKGHGSYEEVSEGEFLPAVTGSSHCVVHFYHNEFERCRCVSHRARRNARRHLKPLRPNAEYWTSTWACSQNSTSPRASSKSMRQCDARNPGSPAAAEAACREPCPRSELRFRLLTTLV